MATHDYVIDNSTGANVRADLNLVLQAILTNNSSSSAPSTTAAYMWWADTTNGILKIRNSANNAWVELLQLDGTLTLEDGSASTPALAFRDDLDTGIYSSADNKFNVATAGTERMELAASGTVFNEDGADVDFRIEGDTEANLFYVDAGNDRIGIGTSSPSELFHIKSSSADCNILFESTGSGTDARIKLTGRSNGVSQIQFADEDDGNVGLLTYDHSTNSMQFRTNDSERIRIDSSGRLLIGTTSVGDASADELTVAGSSNSGITIRSGSSNYGQIFFSRATSGTGQYEGYVAYQHSTDSLQFATDHTERMRIDSSGNVIIGTNDSDPAQLEVRYSTVPTYLTSTFDGTVGEGTLSINVPRTSDGSGSWGSHSNTGYGSSAIQVLSHPSTGGYISFLTGNADNTNPTENMRIDSSGNLLVGTTSTSNGSVGTKIEQGGQLLVSIRNTTSQNIFCNKVGVNGTFITFAKDSGTKGSITTDGTNTAYNTSSDYRLKENETLISDGITRLKTLKPYRFNWKSDKNKVQDGFFAHEVTAVPEAITGIKDEIATEDNDELDYKKGEPIYQSLDYSKLTPLLTAALQEAIAKIEVLETKVAALEAA